MKLIIKALRQNWANKALSLLVEYDRELSIRQVRKITHYANETGFYSIIKFLWEVSIHRYDIPPVRRYHMLIRAIRNNDIYEVRLIFNDREELHLDPSKSDILTIACETGNLEIVSLLLTDERVDPSAIDNYAIRLASKYGHTEIVELLEGARCILLEKV